MELYKKYGIETVGDWKSTVIEMRDSGYISKNDTSYLVMFEFLKDKETAKQNPGMTALDVRTQRQQTAKDAATQKKATDQKTLNALFSTKWSMGDIPCNLNGGTYKELGDNFRMGMRLVLNGKITETKQRTTSKFTVNNDGSVTHYYEIYAQGNKLMEQLLGSPNGIVSTTTVRYRIEGQKLHSDSIDNTVDLERLLKRQGLRFDRRTNSSISVKCPK
jgi:hypothetical protein